MFRFYATNVMKNGGKRAHTQKHKKYCTYIDHMVETVLFQNYSESKKLCWKEDEIQVEIFTL